MATGRQVFIDLIKYRFNLDEGKADEEEIIASIKRNIEFKGANLWTLIFAIFIASIGLNVNSTAVIIGAMLISPLMGPIMGIGLGLGIFDFELIKNALKNLFVAVTISLITSTIYFTLTPLHTAHSELLARSSPTIWDVLIALFGGLAGIVASSRKNISNAIPGVAIATALMPPLCTAGYGLGTGDIYFFLGAFYLFLINCVFISISTFLIVRFLKFQPAHYVDKKFEEKMRRYIWWSAILTILPSVYLAYKFVGQEIFIQKVNDFVNKEVRSKNLLVMDKTIDPNKNTLELVLYGEQLNDSLCATILAEKSDYGLEKTEVVIKQTLNDRERNRFDGELKLNATKVMEAQLIEKDKRIFDLSGKLNQHERLMIDTSLYSEFRSLFGETKELIITKALVPNDSIGRDTVTFVYYSLLKHAHKANPKQLESWLRVRTRSKQVKVFSK